MLNALAMLLPALIPSWRFFDTVGPSPRIEVWEDATAWRALCPEPARLSSREIIGRLFWSPDRNATLFLTSCAERVLETGSADAQKMIERLIRSAAPDASRFRIVLWAREGVHLTQDIAFEAAIPRPANQ